jgi:hypothetical protein
MILADSSPNLITKFENKQRQETLMTVKKTDTDRIAAIRKKIEDLERQIAEVQKEFPKSKIKAGKG